MPQEPIDPSRLTAEEKRALLAKLLRQKVAATETTSAGFNAVVAAARDQLAAGPGVAARDLSATELRAEATLDPTIVPHGPTPGNWTDPDQVFLTGATGFLGGYLLRELLDRTRAVVHCLVRAANPEQGQRRLRSLLVERGVWEDRFSERIAPVVGDLTLPRFGLSESDFDALANRVEAIYHNGALVNFLARYSALRGTNVHGTTELLRLACRRAVPVHMVSSVSVIPLFDYLDTGVIPEMNDLDPDRPVQGGYVQSKWVAEKLVHAARERGLPTTIYRPGYVAGHSQSGISNLDDLVCRILKSCVTGQVAPSLDVEVDVTPVDYVAAAVVHLSRRPDSLGHAFYLVNPRPILWTDILAKLRSLGYPVQEIPYALWQQFLTQHSTASVEQNPMAMLSALFPVAPSEVASVPRFRWDCSRTEAGLADASVACPPASAELIGKYVAYLIRCGFLPPPKNRP